MLDTFFGLTCEDILDVDAVKKHLQDFFSSKPMVLIGSGLSLGEGISGMWQLSQHLKDKIPSLVSGDLLEEWKEVESKIDLNIGFEDAMASLSPDSELIEHIVSETALLIVSDEKEIIKSVIVQEKQLSFSPLLRHLLFNQDELVVVTPNYDRLIELACESSGLDIITGFNSYYCGEHAPDNEKNKIRVLDRNVGVSGKVTVRTSFKKHVKIFKPHGSLDWYEINGKVVRTQSDIDARRLIITPGTSKFREGYQRPFDYHRESANQYIQKSKAILIIGYGFNDEQLEVQLLKKLQEGIPALVITKVLSANAIKICTDLDNVTLVSVGENDSETIVNINGIETKHNAKWWSLADFIDGVLE